MNASKKIRIVAALGTLSAGVWAGTFAAFTDSGNATATFTSGTIDLKIDGADNVTATSLQMTNLKPGSSSVAPLTIANPDGAATTELPFNYAMATSVTNADTKNLGARLQHEAVKVALAADCTAAGFNTLYGAVGAVTTAKVALSSAAIASRPLAVGASEIWCFRVSMPTGTSAEDNPYQGAATTATFAFTATQQ